LPEETKEIVERELKKLRKLGSQSQEYHVGLSYLQTISELPWGIFDAESLDPKRAQEVLDKDHYGLDIIKKRIV
jgi:ATP-dependent Lon protease